MQPLNEGARVRLTGRIRTAEYEYQLALAKSDKIRKCADQNVRDKIADAWRKYDAFMEQ